MRIALAQMLSTYEPHTNLALISDWVAEAAANGAQMVVFPEAAMCAFGVSLVGVAQQLNGDFAVTLRNLARQHNIVIVAGMFTPATGAKVFNTLLVAGPNMDAHYNKIHLYDAFGFQESNTVEAGTTPVTFQAGGLTFGLTTCYDVRFPALYTANANAGAHVNIVCASWGAGPGKADQWDLLTTARALDSTTFVIAVDQADPQSVNNNNQKTNVTNAPTGIGRSAVISPTGRVLTRLDANPQLAYVDLDPAEITQARHQIPVLANAISL